MNTRLNLVVGVFFVIVCFPAYKALRHPGLISGHDAESVVFRSIEFRQALADGHFPVRWSKRLDYGLGQPTFTFVYNLPYYLSATLGRFGMDVTWAYKLLIALSFPVSGWLAWLWLKQHFPGRAALVGGVVYTYVPYHFANVYVRGAFGEVFAATLVPWVMYLVVRLAKNQELARACNLAVGLGLLALSHNMYLIVLLPIVFVYYLVCLPKITKRSVWYWVAGVGVGLTLAAYYLIPALAYKDLTYLSGLGNWFVKNTQFLTWDDLLIPHWGFGGLRKASGEGLMSMQIGLVQVASIVLAGYLTLQNRLKVNKKILLFFWIVLLGAIFMVQEVSLLAWKLLPVLENLQFPWRLMFVVNIVTAFFTSAVLASARVWKLGVVIVLAIVANHSYWHVDRYYIWPDPTEKTIGYPGHLTMLLEDTPKWHVDTQESNPYHLTQFSGGNGDAPGEIWKTNYERMRIVCKDDCIVSFKTHYWPGWIVYLDAKPVPLLDPYNPHSEGVITFKVPFGEHIAEARLVEPPLNKVANSITVLAVVGLALARWRPASFQRYFAHRVGRR